METEDFLDKYHGIIAGIGVVVLLSLLFIFKCDYKNNEMYYRQNLSDEEYKGIIKRKFIDENNHYMETLILQVDNEIQIRLYTRSWINLWDSCKIGDEIIKEKGKQELLLKNFKYDSLYFKFEREGEWGMQDFQLENLEESTMNK